MMATPSDNMPTKGAGHTQPRSRPRRVAATPKAEPDKTATGKSGTNNPAPQSFDLRFSIPAIEVKMVNASALSDYDVWLFLASLFSSTSVGFFVAFLQQSSDQTTPASTHLIFGIVMAVAATATLIRAILIRRSISKEAKSVRMRATEVVD